MESINNTDPYSYHWIRGTAFLNHQHKQQEKPQNRGDPGRKNTQECFRLVMNSPRSVVQAMSTPSSWNAGDAP
jgi:hypothetical protein